MRNWRDVGTVTTKPGDAGTTRAGSKPVPGGTGGGPRRVVAASRPA
jgi:hypothetical protein